MKKKILFRILTFLFAASGFAIIIFVFTLDFSSEAAIRHTAFLGLGFPSLTQSRTSIFQRHKPEKELYTYINIPYISEGQPYYLSLSLPEKKPEETLPEQNETTPPEKADNIMILDMSGGQTQGHILTIDESGYAPDADYYAKCDYPIEAAIPTMTGQTSEPLVLIVHSHGTECYLPSGQAYTDENTLTHSTQPENGVVGIGRILTDILESKGIKTIHCETMFDAESYSDAYDNSERAVLDYLELYPSIQYVFDVHRDSLAKDDGTVCKPLAEDGETAQIMFVVGTDAGGADHPYWEDNLTVACHFQDKLLGIMPSFVRPMNIRRASFNAEHRTGSVLIEIGSSGNSFDEAEKAAVLLGNAIAEVILYS